jgi:lysozyme
LVCNFGLRVKTEQAVAVHTVSSQGLERIAAFEGYRARATALPDGRHTIGFGHVASARAGATITRVDALLLLRHDLQPVEMALRGQVRAPLTQSQFDSLASFAFNIGLDAFLASDVLRFVNAGEPIAAALAMGDWRAAQVHGRLMTVDALVRRRVAEMDLFLTPPPDTMRPAAPTPALRPQRAPVGPAAPLCVDVADAPAPPLSEPPQSEAERTGETEQSPPPLRPIDQTMAAIRARLQDVGVQPLAAAPSPRIAERSPPPAGPSDDTASVPLADRPLPDAACIIAPSAAPLGPAPTHREAQAPGCAPPEPVVPNPAAPNPAASTAAVATLAVASPAAPAMAPPGSGAPAPLCPGDDVHAHLSPAPPATEPSQFEADLSWSEPPLLEVPEANVRAPVGTSALLHDATPGEALANAAAAPARQGILAPLAVTVAGVTALAFGLYRLAGGDPSAVTSVVRADVLIAAIGFLAALVGAAIAAERLAKR